MYLRLKSDEEISYENNIIKRTILCPLFIIVLLIVIPFVIFAIYKYFGHQDSVLLLILILAALIFLILFMCSHEKQEVYYISHKRSYY
jgi:uncharacterized membrane protein YhaH (DUF805 family)